MSASSSTIGNSPERDGEKEGTLTFVNFLLPYLIIILAQIPLLVMYYKNLWGRSHYQAFVFGFLALAYFLYFWWPRKIQGSIRASWSSVALMVTGLLFAFLATIFVTPWFACFSFLCLLASLFVRTQNQETGRSLLPLVLLLAVFLQPPTGIDFDTVRGDQQLVGFLQQKSSSISSYFLDLLGYKHNLVGNVIEMPNTSVEEGVKPYHVEEACSGVQSFFTLLFLTAFFSIYLKRPWFRAFLLILSAMFWALIMNTIRIVMIPIADITMNLDLGSGLPHMAWGYVALIIGAILVLSTDQLLIFLFGPVDAASNEESSTSRGISSFWNRTIAGENDGEPHFRPVTKLFRVCLWPIAGVMIFVFLWQSVDVVRSIAAPGTRVRFFDNDETFKIVPTDAPENIGQGNFAWTQVDYRSQNRKRSSDLGQRSDQWVYRSQSGFSLIASFDQVFPGWHELTTCYKSQGYKITSDDRRKTLIEDSDWPMIECEMRKPTGEYGYLLFCLCDHAGQPYDAPGDWGSFNSLMTRIGNRMSYRVRSRLFHGEGYQLQVFINTEGTELPNDIKEDIKRNFDEFRMNFREKIESGELVAGGEHRGSVEDSASENTGDGSSTN